jgi:hypothetical protein
MYDFWALSWLFHSLLFVRTMYEVVHLNLHDHPIYNKLPHHRQLYIQKNIVKSVILCILFIFASITILPSIINHDQWNSYLIHRIAALYGANDILGLLIVDKLPKTTKLHHQVSTIFVICAFNLDFQVSSVAQALLVYTFASASAYIVNCHLAMRLFAPKHIVNKSRLFSALIYTCSCSICWCWHIWWWFTIDKSLIHIAYILLLYWIIRDDIILMQWLCKDINKN